MSYPPYGGQGSYQPAPAGGYPQTGQPTFPVQYIMLYLWLLVTEFSVHSVYAICSVFHA